MDSEEKETVRAFIAVEISEEIKDNILLISAKLGGGGARAVRRAQLHVTLLFLGDINEKQLNGMKNILEKIRHMSFSVSLKGCGAFPNPSKPRVIVLRINDGTRELTEIYHDIAEHMPELQIKIEEREFRPHITIARMKRFNGGEIKAAKEFINTYSEYDFGSFDCTEIKLKRSTLGENGPVYTDLYAAKLTS